MNAKTKKTLRGALIGYGFVSANGHAAAYRSRPDIQIAAVADISPARRSAAQQAFPAAKAYGDHMALLEKEAPELDFVDIATPPHAHAITAQAALGAGLHVLCEKPLACDINQAFTLLEQAQDAKRVLFPCHNYRHAPAIAAINKIIHSGRIGKVRKAVLKTWRDTHAKGVHEWKSNWRRDSRYSGGGIAMDHGTHSFYLTFDWLGSYPISISAAMSNLDPQSYDTEDEFMATLRFRTGTAQVHLSWTAGRRQIIYIIEGDKGTITLEDDCLAVKTLETNKSSPVDDSQRQSVETRSIDSAWNDASHAGWFNPMLDDFRRAIANNVYAGKDAKEAVLCVQLINTAYRSARAGSRELPITPMLGDRMGSNAGTLIM